LWVNDVKPNGDIIRSVSIGDASNVMKFGQVYLNGNVQTGSIHHRILAAVDKGDKKYVGDWYSSHALDTAGSFNIYNPTYGSPANGYPTFDRSKPIEQRAGIYSTLAQQYTGGYLQDELGFFDNKLRLTLAGRVTYVTDNSYGTVVNDHKITPRAGISYSVDSKTSVYALYDQTFLPQSGIQRSGERVRPVTGNSMEMGIKKDWLGGKWNTTASVYRILKNNELSNDPANTASESFVLQLGQTKSQGIELDVRGEIIRGLNLVANYAYTDSKISKESSAGKVGDVVPGYAKHTANAWLSYHVPSGVVKGLGVNAGFTYLADRTTWSWGVAGQQQLPNYFKLDGGLTYETGNISINFNVFNLLNKYLYSGSYYGYGGYYYWQAEAGRNSRIGVSYRF
jgi:iron complex outermembrane receptor protein